MAVLNVLNDWIVTHAPPQMLPLLKRVYWRLLLQPDVQVLPLKSLYDRDVELHCHVEPSLQPISEARHVPMAPFAPRLHNGCYKIPEDYVTVLNEVLYCPVNNVVMTERGKIIAESLCAGISMKPFPRKQSTLEGYCTPWRTPKNNYYHTLIDNLPRLLSLCDFTSRRDQAVRLIYSGELSKAESYYLDRFCPPHIELVQLPARELFNIENLILTPFKTRRYAGYLPKRYSARLRNTLLPDRPSRREHRLFVSRANATRRRILNEGALIAALTMRGFKTVHLESLSVEEQIRLFYDAEIVVGAHGAGLANILFGDSLQILELFPCSHVVPHYFYLSRSLDHRYAYWCGEEVSHHSDFEVDVDQVLSLLNGMGITEQRSPKMPMGTTLHQRKSSEIG